MALGLNDDPADAGELSHSPARHVVTTVGYVTVITPGIAEGRFISSQQSGNVDSLARCERDFCTGLE